MLSEYNCSISVNDNSVFVMPLISEQDAANEAHYKVYELTFSVCLGLPLQLNLPRLMHAYTR